MHRDREPFCLINEAIQPVELTLGALGSTLAAIGHGLGDAVPLPEARRLVTGEAMRPPSPCHLTLWCEGDGLRAQWIRRSHEGWEWLDEVGVPDDRFAELYRLTVEGSRGTVTFETSEPSFACDIAQLPAASGEAIKLTIATVGPRAVSHGIAAILTI